MSDDKCMGLIDEIMSAFDFELTCAVRAGVISPSMMWGG